MQRFDRSIPAAGGLGDGEGAAGAEVVADLGLLPLAGDSGGLFPADLIDGEAGIGENGGLRGEVGGRPGSGFEVV